MGLKEANLTMDLDQNDCCGDVPINAWCYSHGPYWIVLFSSLWKEQTPLLLLIDTVLKVWSGSWQRLRESQD